MVIYTNVLPLNTKFTFIPEKERDAKHFLKISAMHKALEDDAKSNYKDYWHIEYRTPYDYINTWASSFKPQSVAAAPLTFGEYEALKLNREKEAWEY